MPQIVDIPGEGEIEFPDSMSGDEINAAIRKHTSWKEPTLTDRAIGAAKTVADTVSGLGTLKQNFTHSLAKGVPILGKLLPENASHQQFEKDHPWVSNAAEITGGTAALGPVFGATGTVAKGLAGAGIDAATMAAIGMGDRVAEKRGDVTASELRNVAMINALAGGFGRMATRGVTPKPNPKIEVAPPASTNITAPAIDAKTLAHLKSSTTPEDFLKITQKGTEKMPLTPAHTQEMLEASLNKSKMNKYISETADIEAKRQAQIAAVKQNPPSWAEDIPANLMGGLAGHMVGGIPGMLIGALAGPHVKPIASKVGSAWAGNQVMTSPANKAFLQAVLGQASINGLDKD